MEKNASWSLSNYLEMHFTLAHLVLFILDYAYFKAVLEMEKNASSSLSNHL
jgi:hypothetical protein